MMSQLWNLKKFRAKIILTMVNILIILYYLFHQDIRQKVVVTYARKSIAGFKVREGWPIGVKVTLRRERMYEFLDRLLSISLPRVRDFRGLNAKSFDGRGNYSMGVKEQIIFPEIDYDKIDALRGLDITLTTTAKNDDEGRALLRAFKFPFRN